MIVRQADDGTWSVLDGDRVVASGLTNARAWQVAERSSPADVKMDETRQRISYHMGQW